MQKILDSLEEDSEPYASNLTILRQKHLQITDHLELLVLNEGYYNKIISQQKEQASDETKKRHKELKDKIAEYTKKSAELDKEIKQIEKFKIENQPKLDIPKLGNNDSVNIEHLKLSAVPFDGETDTISLEEWWMKLSTFGSANNFSEKAYKFSISCLTTKEAFQIFYAKKDESLKIILETFVNKYGPLLTLEDYCIKLENLKREPNENIISCMTRVDILIDKTQRNVSDLEQKERKKILRNQYLLKLAYPFAKSKLQMMQDRFLKIGEILSYKQSLEIVENAEKYQSSNLSLSALEMETIQNAEKSNESSDEDMDFTTNGLSFNDNQC